jgi:hypothetical protein
MRICKCSGNDSISKSDVLTGSLKCSLRTSQSDDQKGSCFSDFAIIRGTSIETVSGTGTNCRRSRLGSDLMRYVSFSWSKPATPQSNRSELI